MRGWIFYIISAFVLFLSIADGKASAQTNEILLIANGKLQKYNPKPLIVNGETFVPFTEIFKSLGAQVKWNNTTKNVTVTKGQKMIVFNRNSLIATVNGKKIPLSKKVKVVKNRIMVPISFVRETMDAKVSWDPKKRIVIIVSKTGNVMEEKLLHLYQLSSKGMLDHSGIMLNMKYFQLPKMAKQSKWFTFAWDGEAALSHNGLSVAFNKPSPTMVLNPKECSKIVRLGMNVQFNKWTIQQLKKVLGNPRHEGESPAGGDWELYYPVQNKYVLIFSANDKKSTITSVNLFNKRM